MKEVGPLGFAFRPKRAASDLYFAGLSESDMAALLLIASRLPYFCALSALYYSLGPFSLLVLTNLIAYSLVKQSQIPSQATIIKSYSSVIYTCLTSGKEVT